jgi:hypothetical protein
MRWLVVLGVVTFAVLLFYLAWAYAKRSLKDASNDPASGRRFFLPHASG